jgi:hypothetical protein
MLLFVYSLDNIKIKIVKYILIPVYLFISVFFGYFGILNLIENSDKYKLSGIESKVKGFHSWHATQGGSVYNLGEIEFTVTGIVKKIFPAINVTYFRLYLWEVKNLVMLLSSIESLMFFILFIRLIFFKTKYIKLLFNDKFIFSLLIYCLILGFVVGFIWVRLIFMGSDILCKQIFQPKKKKCCISYTS